MLVRPPIELLCKDAVRKLEEQYRRRETNVDYVELYPFRTAKRKHLRPAWVVSYVQGEIEHGYVIQAN
jgi:hypothetical protein